MTARAVTGGEQTLLRGAGQHSEVYFWIHNPATVFNARINQATFSDPVIEITYDGGVGTYTNIKPGMTLRVGSIVGEDDLGKLRIRKAATATKLYVGAEGGILWAEDAYLTVVDDFEVWWKRAVLQGDNTYQLDEDLDYAGQHALCDPIARIGCDGAAWLSAGTVTVEWHADSYVFGSTIAGHYWTVTGPGAVTITGLLTADATFTVTVAGTYRVNYTAIAATGTATNVYRYLYVFDAAHPPLKCEWKKISGSQESGGYGTTITLRSQAGLTQVRPGARVLMFCRDWFGNTQSDLGPLDGRENVLLAGWIGEKESIVGDPRLGSVSFAVLGGAEMMRKLTGQPVFLKDTDSAPERWTRFQGMTLDHFLWHLCHWRSTVDVVMDTYFTESTLMAGEFITEADSLWEKLYNQSTRRMLARPGVNRYGQLFVRIDPQVLDATARAALVTVQTIDHQDWEAPLEFERETQARVARLDLSGIAYTSITSYTPYYSKAPGVALLRRGAYETKDYLMLVDQDHANELAGLMLAAKNNLYPMVPVVLKANNRFIDFAEPAYVAMNLAAGDTLRGIVWSGKKLLATRVEIVFNAGTGRLHTEVEFEAETTGVDGITVIPEQPPVVNTPPAPPVPNYNPPGWGSTPWYPPYIPSFPRPGTCGSDDGLANGPYGLTWDKATILAGETAYAYFPCSIRASSELRKTYMMLAIAFLGDAYSNYALTAIDGGQADVLSPSSVVAGNPMLVNWEPVGCTDVAGFKLALAAGGGESYLPGDAIASGTVQATDSTGSQVTGLYAGDWYCVEGAGGPWNPGGGYGDQWTIGVQTAPGGSENMFFIGKDNDGVMCTVVNGSGGAAYAEAANSTYGRGYFQSNGGPIYITVGEQSANWGDNSGTMSWLVRKATVIPARKILLNRSSLSNVVHS
jgi:hypothetical protein